MGRNISKYWNEEKSNPIFIIDDFFFESTLILFVYL